MFAQVLQQSLVESENRLAEQQVTESSVGRAEGHVPAPHGGAHSQQAEEDKTAKVRCTAYRTCVGLSGTEMGLNRTEQE